MSDMFFVLLFNAMRIACWSPWVARACSRSTVSWLLLWMRVLILALVILSAALLAAEHTTPLEEQDWDAPMGGSFAFLLVCTAFASVLIAWAAVVARKRPAPITLPRGRAWLQFLVALPLFSYVCGEQLIYVYPLAKSDFLTTYAPNSAAYKQMIADSTSPTPVAVLRTVKSPPSSNDGLHKHEPRKDPR